MKETVPYDEAVAMLDPDAPYIHTFVPAGPMLLGADMERDQLLAVLRDVEEIELAGPLACAIKHGLVVKHGGHPMFIATIINK